MSVDFSPPSSAIQALGILVVDDNPVFRLGLRIGLERFPDLQVLADVGDGQAALDAIAQFTVVPSPTEETPPPALNIVVLTVELGRVDPTQMQGLALCRHIKTQYPELPVLMLGQATEPIILGAAQQVGANGYCLRSIEIEELASILRRLATGQSLWVAGESSALAAQESNSVAQRSLQEGALEPASPSSGGQSQLVETVQRWRRGLRRSGIRQIDDTLAEVVAQLQTPDLSSLERAILAGQYRELRAARWIVNQLLATPNLTDRPVQPTTPPIPPVPPFAQPGRDRPPEEPVVIVPSDSPAQAIARLQSIVLDAVLAKLQNPLQNLTPLPLEIDILREERKRELFYLILRHIERLLDELRYSQVGVEQLAEKRSQLLVDLWEVVTTDFFGKYYTVDMDSQSLTVVDSLLRDRVIIQTEILEKIPFTTDLLAHFLFQSPLNIDGQEFPVGNPAAVERAQIILEHWMIQIANAVMQPLLNVFAHVESIKQNLYDRRLMSSREIERFRNDLSWRYRLNNYFAEPQAIFESRYVLFTFRGRGIRQTSIYAPRTQELGQLSGIPFVVTLALETRDALAPRVRSVISFVGSSVVYILTEVVGRGIGLIGRGILKGIGSSWQDGRFTRDSGFSRDSEGQQ